MKFCQASLIVLLLGSATAMAAQPSDAAIDELLVVSHAQKLVDSQRAQLDVLMARSVQQVLNGRKPNAAQQLAIDHMVAKMSAMTQDELNWEKIRPLYVRVYKDTFTDEDIAGMLAFYNTPAGQSMIEKMPLLMQKIMGEMQTFMMVDMPKRKKIQEEFIAEMHAASAK
jgi:uncharacterized protein